jgi:hypothetical protein
MHTVWPRDERTQEIHLIKQLVCGSLTGSGSIATKSPQWEYDISKSLLRIRGVMMPP